MSIWKTRFRRWAHVMAAWRSAGVLSSGWSRSLFLLLPLPRPDGVMAARCLLLGAKTPWKRVKLTLGFGTRAARRDACGRLERERQDSEVRSAAVAPRNLWRSYPS